MPHDTPNVTEEALKVALVYEPDWPPLHREFKRKHLTLSIRWDEYIEQHPDGFRYSRFCELYRVRADKLLVTMRQVHLGGAKLFVDYAGDTVPVLVDRLRSLAQSVEAAQEMGVEAIRCVPSAGATPAMPDDTPLSVPYPAVARKKVTAAFDGGRLLPMTKMLSMAWSSPS